jgi:flavin-dependent thymidylate synthase
MSIESKVGLDKMEYIDLLNTDHSKINLYENNGIPLGYVELIDIMPRIIKKGQTGDVAVVDGARMSYKQKPGKFEAKTEVENKGLIDYLVEHYHTSPLELAEVKFMVCAPLFVFNQLVRHRTANLNVISRRYTEIEEENTYIPELRYQDDINKQGSKSSFDSI